MNENKIFIDNFYEQSQSLAIGISDSSSSKIHHLITGLHPKIENSIIKEHTVSEIFKGLLLHDKVVIKTSDLLYVISAFGIKDTIELVKAGKFEFIDDKGLTLVLEQESKDFYSLADIRHARKDGDIKDSIGWLENRLWDSKTNNNNDLSVLLLNIEKNNKLIDVDSISDRINNETKYDIKNSNVVNHLNLSSDSTKAINKIDAFNILRISKLNKSLIYSSNLGINNLSIDAAVKPILGVKLSPASQSLISTNLYDSFFQDFLKKKEIPDLALLYLKGIITINDYLEIITSLTSVRFRNWIMEKDYDPDKLFKDLINMNPKISNKVYKYIRWLIPNVVGLVDPVAGLTSSFVDSFIIDKISKGWHPNLFLDEYLKNRIDKKIEIHDRNERLKSIKKRFPNTGRNDSCPCGGGKKFKKCCGN